jgi:GT2 family glycosyltransferase
VKFAESLGIDVVELDPNVPFTAARARNAGVERLRCIAPEVEYVQLIDGDCEIAEGWIDEALAFLKESPDYAAAAGRLRERFSHASIYNYICDFEWDTPIGDAEVCGGIAMMHVGAFESVGGFNASLIAGEEPELCVRLRQKGWKIRRIDAEMALHDAAMSRFSQYWKRTVRSGHAYAEGAHMHGASAERHWVRESRRVAVWGLLLPLVAFAAAPFTTGLSLLLLFAYPLNVARIARRLRKEGRAQPAALASHLVLSKIPQAVGWLRFHWGERTGKRSKLLEYKAS